MANRSRKAHPTSIVWHLDECERRILLCELHAVYIDPPSSGVLMGPALPVASSPLSAVPLLHSRPGATAKLYLDFDGDAASTWGGYSVPATPAYDADGDATSFSDQELSNIREIWARVAEKYSAFNLDVTTEYPGDLNDRHALRAVIGGTGSWYAANSGGVSYVGGFYNSSSNTVYVFSANLGNGNPFYTAEGVAHESGHGFGLQHQSTYSGTTKTAEYNAGDSLRAPIMGSSYYAQRGLWWNGTSSISSTTVQDDLAVIANTSTNRFGYRTDDYGNTSTAAGALTLSSSNAASASGVIENTSDADWLSFTLTSGGSVSFTASVGSYVRANAGITVAADGGGATLDLALELRDAAGNLITSADTASLGESVSASGLAAGTYYLVVRSHGSYGDIGTYDVTGTVTPSQATAPTANAGGPYTVNEGGSAQLSGGGSTAGDGSASGLTYLWDLDGDGLFGETGSGATRGDETGSSPTFLAAALDGPATYAVSLKVTDAATGLTSAVATATVGVTNMAPTPSIVGGPAGNSGPEGTAISLTGSATDPGVNDTVTYAWSVTKNGSAFAAGSGSAFAFTPSDNGTYVVTLTATDKDGGAGTTTRTLTVTNVAPTASISGAPATSPEGTPISLTGAAVDPGTLDTLTYAWAVTKNGAPFTSGTGNAFSFTPSDNGTYVVTLTATDKDGGAGTATKTITVTNVAPTPSIAGAPPTATEGSVLSLTGSATDPAALDTLTYAWSVTKNGAAYASGSGQAFTLTPDDDGTYVVTLTATDDDGGSASTSRTVSVANVAPFVMIGGAPATSPEGTSLWLTSSVTDPGMLDTAAAFTYAWHVTRDGVAYKSGSAATFMFTPNDNATYVLTLAVTDKDGGVGTDTETITVTNVAPVPTISGAPATSPEGTAIALTGSATDVGTLDASLTYAWAVTKNGSPYASGAGPALSFTPDDDASYVVSFTATDKDGGSATASQTITVTNVAPTLALTGPTQVAPAAPYTLNLSATDPGADTIAGWSIDWGDGTVDTLAGNATSATHTYAADGTYPIAASARDEDGTFAAVPARSVTVATIVDTVAPTATFGSAGATTAGATAQTFTVFYADDGDLNDASLGDGDVLVTGPNGFSQLARFVSLERDLHDSGRTVTYSFTPPGGSWSYTANGTYTLQLQAGQVTDAAGNPAAAAALGAFAVRLPIPDLGGTSTDTAAYIGIVSPGYATTSTDFLSRGDRNDYFRLRLKQTTPLAVKLYGMTDDADLQLLDGAGRVVQTSARVGTRSEVITRTLAAGTYYLRAYYGGASSTPYWLRVSSGVGATTALAPDAAGNTPALAAYVGILAPPSLHVYADALTAAGDANDYYRFRLKQSATFDASLYGLTDDAQLALLDASGRAIRLSRNTGPADEVVSRTLAAGTYYLRVFSDRPLTTQYTLAFAVGAAAAPTVTAVARPSLLSTFSTRPLVATTATRELLTGGSLAA